VFATDGCTRIAFQLHKLMHGIIQVDHHDDSSFYGDAEEGDETHGNTNGKAYVKEINEVCPANQCKRNGDEAQKSLPQGVESEVQREEDDDEHDWRNPGQCFLSADHVFIL